jgi:hypothetical protein
VLQIVEKTAISAVTPPVGPDYQYLGEQVVPPTLQRAPFSI